MTRGLIRLKKMMRTTRRRYLGRVAGPSSLTALLDRDSLEDTERREKAEGERWGEPSGEELGSSEVRENLVPIVGWSGLRYGD